MSDFRASIKAVLDTSDLENQIHGLNKKYLINLGVNSLDTNDINRQMKSAGGSAGDSFTYSFNSAIGKIKVENTSSAISNMKDTLAHLKFDRSSINTITKDLEEMNLTVKNVSTQMNGEKLKVTVKGIDELGRAVTVAEEFNTKSGEISTAGKKISQSFSQSTNEVKKFNQEIVNLKAEKLSNDIKSWKIDNPKTAERYDTEVSRIQASLGTTNLNPEGLSKLSAEFAKIKSEAKAAFGQSTNEAKKFNQEILQLKSQKLSNDITSWMNANPKAAKAYGDSLSEIKNQLNEPLDLENFRKLSAEFAMIKSQAKAAGLTTRSFFTNVKDISLQLLGLTSTVAVIQKGIEAAKKMYQNVYNIDTAMTNLKKVTDETDTAYSNFLTRSANSAKELGRTISGLITQTSEWAKLGYSLDEAEKLSKLSSIYANVGEVDDKAAVSDMVTAMKAYQIEASNAINIIDIYNELGNKFAISSAALGEGISKSASAMHLAGADLAQTSAMLTGIGEITQDVPEAGNALKIFSMRIRGMKGDLEALGEEVDPTIESISKVQTQILNLTKGKVNIFDSEGNFRNYYEIMKEIAAIYDDLAATDKASLTEVLFGKQRGNAGAALIQAFQSGQIEKAYSAALNSDGSAMAEQEKWMESLEAKTQQFKAALEGLSQVTLNSDFLKGAIDGGTTFLSILSKIIDGVGLLPIGTVSAGIGLLVKNFD